MAKYLTIINGNFGFREEKVLENDVQISDEIYETFILNQEQGKEYKIKNINGATFEEIFEEIPPAVPSQEELIRIELAELDTFLPRCIEDLITARGIDIATLPQIMQDRLNRKTELRAQLQTILGS